MRPLALALLTLLLPLQALAVCGDGVLDGTDVCDDGNTSGGDMCSADCTAFNFELINQSAEIVGNPSVTGRYIRELVPFDFRLYAAYGDEDYNSNAGTGPTAIMAFDPATGAWVDEGDQESEAIDSFRDIDGTLWLPNIDYHHIDGNPTDFSTTDSFMTSTGDGVWVLGSTTSSFTHAYSVVQLGSSIYMSGGYGTADTGHSAIVDVTTDGGATWANSLEIAAENSGSYARFYFIAKLGTDLWTQAYDIGVGGSGLHTNSRKFNGTSWSTGPQLSPGLALGQNPIELGSYIIYKGAGDTLRKFNGTTDALARTAVYDYTTAYDGTVYVLETDNQIWTTTDGDSFTLFATGPTNSRSVGILNNRLYVGDFTGQIYRTELELRCGDLTVDAGETCDFTNLNSQTCVTQSYKSGTLACANDCTFSYASCVSFSGVGINLNGAILK